MSRTDLSRSRGDGGGLEEEEGEALHGEVDEGAAGMCEEAPKVGSHHALPPDAVPLVELLRGEKRRLPHSTTESRPDLRQ